MVPIARRLKSSFGRLKDIIAVASAPLGDWSLSGVGFWADFGSVILPKAWTSWRLVLAPLAACPPAFAQPPQRAHHAALDPSRNAARRPCDGRIVDPGRSRRGSLADAPIEIERALASAVNGPQASGQELWLVAEHAAHIVRIARDARSGSPNLRQLCWSARTSP
jgi:hypothetical protein